MNRYELLPAGEKTIIYDRLSKTGKIVDAKHDDELKSLLKEDIAFQGAIYPNKALSPVRINTSFHLFLYLTLILALFILSFLVCINLQYAKGSILLSILVVPIVMPFSMVIHELSHALIGASLGGIVAEVGATSFTPFRLHTVLFWINTDLKKRCLYLFAGVASNIVLSILFFIIFIHTKRFEVLSIGLVNVFLSFLNAIPLKRLNSDGYKIVCAINEDRL